MYQTKWTVDELKELMEFVLFHGIRNIIINKKAIEIHSYIHTYRCQIAI